MKTAQKPRQHTQVPKPNPLNLKPTPTALLNLIYPGTSRTLRPHPCELLDQAIDTLLLDMLQKLFPTEYARCQTIEDIRLFASRLEDVQLSARGVPEGYWWHLRNLPEDIQHVSRTGKPGDEIALVFSTPWCRERFHHEEWDEAVRMTYGRSIEELVEGVMVGWEGNG